MKGLFMDIKKLIDDINCIIIEKAHENKKDFDHESINWANLSCTDVETGESFMGGKFIRVIIEEAAPECFSFKQFILDELYELGYREDITIVTEW